MGIKKKLKQYGNLLVALSMVIGFGATFMLYNTGGSQAPQDQERETNFTAPSQTFKDGSFGKSYAEQVVIAAREDRAFVNLYYDNESQKQQLQQLQSLGQTFPDKLYIQMVNPTQEGEGISTRADVTDFPAAVVLGGTATQRGAAPLETTVYPVNQTEVEKAICNTLTNLPNSFAYCQSIGAF